MGELPNFESRSSFVLLSTRLLGLTEAPLRPQYYHTSKDLVKNIQVGSTQHFGANVLSLVDSLTSPGSRLPYIEKKGSKKQTLGSSSSLPFLSPSLTPLLG